MVVYVRGELMGSWHVRAIYWLKNMAWYISANTFNRVFSLLEYMNIEYIWLGHLL